MFFHDFLRFSWGNRGSDPRKITEIQAGICLSSRVNSLSALIRSVITITIIDSIISSCCCRLLIEMVYDARVYPARTLARFASSPLTARRMYQNLSKSYQNWSKSHQKSSKLIKKSSKLIKKSSKVININPKVMKNHQNWSKSHPKSSKLIKKSSKVIKIDEKVIKNH